MERAEFHLIRAHVDSIIRDPAGLMPTHLTWITHRPKCRCVSGRCTCTLSYYCINCNIFVHSHDEKMTYDVYCNKYIPPDLDIKRLRILGQHFSQRIELVTTKSRAYCFICGKRSDAVLYKHKSILEYLCGPCKQKSNKLFCTSLLLLMPHILSELSFINKDVASYIITFTIEVCLI